jgi:hypothetical protein
VQKEKWFQILGVQPIVTKFVYVCSRHFTEDCFYTTPKEIRYLEKTAVPAVHLKKLLVNPYSQE